MLDADEAYFKEHNEPLFSSHMLDMSEESKEENIEICVKYFERMAKIGRELSGFLLDGVLISSLPRDGDRYHRW